MSDYKPSMYRKHDEHHVVDVDLVWPLIPIDDETYQQWLADGNVPLEIDEPNAGN